MESVLTRRSSRARTENIAIARYCREGERGAPWYHFGDGSSAASDIKRARVAGHSTPPRTTRMRVKSHSPNETARCNTFAVAHSRRHPSMWRRSRSMRAPAARRDAHTRPRRPRGDRRSRARVLGGLAYLRTRRTRQEPELPPNDPALYRFFCRHGPDSPMDAPISSIGSEWRTPPLWGLDLGVLTRPRASTACCSAESTRKRFCGRRRASPPANSTAPTGEGKLCSAPRIALSVERLTPLAREDC